MKEKQELYFGQGAKEFWVCDQGNMMFFNRHQALKFSEIIMNFPVYLEIDFA